MHPSAARDVSLIPLSICRHFFLIFHFLSMIYNISFFVSDMYNSDRHCSLGPRTLESCDKVQKEKKSQITFSTFHKPYQSFK